jgi:hypothetical protein
MVDTIFGLERHRDGVNGVTGFMVYAPSEHSLIESPFGFILNIVLGFNLVQRQGDQMWLSKFRPKRSPTHILSK